MTRLALATLLLFGLLVAIGLLLFSGTAWAGDYADMAALIPEEWQRTVVEVTCTELHDCCGVHRACCPGCITDPIPPAPVPLPWGGFLLAGALAALIWRQKLAFAKARQELDRYL